MYASLTLPKFAFLKSLSTYIMEMQKQMATLNLGNDWIRDQARRMISKRRVPEAIESLTASERIVLIRWNARHSARFCCDVAGQF